MGVPQLPLALHYPRDQRLETFIGAPDGALAQLRAIAVGASHDWVYLEGAAGTGKTHQALAMCSSAEQAGRLPTYVPLASAAGRVRAALMGWKRANWWRWTAWTRLPATARTRSRCSISTTVRALRA
jgi:DnaA family protein